MSEKTGSKIFYPYKVIGLVCGKQRMQPNYLGTEVFFTVPIGKSFHVYSAKKLQNIMSSSQLSEDITAVEVSKETTFTAVGRDILKWRRFSVVGTLKGEFGPIVNLLLIGEYLVSTSEDGYLCIWNTTTMELIRTINLGNDFHPSFLMHPNTYLNKVLVGSTTGKLQLWNIRTGSLIMNFKGYSSGITFIQQAPSVDVVAVGLENGEIDVRNLRYDESVMHFQQAATVTSLSFFSNLAKAPLLLSAGSNGHVCLWDIKERRLHYELEDAHEASVHTALFLPDSMRFVTAGADNAMKMWQVDEVDHSPRAVIVRQGHTDSSSLIRFYGSNSVVAREGGDDGLAMSILSAGLDGAFRDFHVMRENINRELSQGSDAKRLKSSRPERAFQRLPVIVDFAYSEGRDRAWSNIATCHEHCAEVYGWKFFNHAKTELRLALPDPPLHNTNYALCCDVNNGGETCVVGYVDGTIGIFNMQSGLYRGSLPREAKKGFVVKQSLLGFLASGAQQEGKGRHTSSVICVGIDITNTMVVSVSRDGTVHFWDLIERTLTREVALPSLPLRAAFSRNTGLLAVALEDRSVVVFDSQTFNLIRRFEVAGAVTALCMNDSGRWLLVADESGDVRVFDLPNSRLIDWIRFERPVLSLAMSCGDEFIASSHRGQIGIHLWANNCFYSDVLLTTAPRAPVLMDVVAPAPAPAEEEEAPTVREPPAEGAAVHLSARVAGGTIALSHAPRTKWPTLSSLEQIRERNKPEEAPKAPEKAPFFLPTTSGLTPAFVAEAKEEAAPKRFVTRGDVLSVESALQRLLRECAEKRAGDEPREDVADIEDEDDVRIALGSFYPVLLHFRDATVAAVDAELQMLCMGPLDAVGTQALRHLFEFFRAAVKAQVDYEMVQALLERTLQLYSEVVASMEEMQPLLKEIGCDQEKGWKRIQGMMQQCLCMVELFSNVQL